MIKLASDIYIYIFTNNTKYKMHRRFECASIISKMRKKQLQFREFHALYLASLGFLGTEKTNFIYCCKCKNINKID